MKRHNGRQVFRAFLQCSAIYVSANLYKWVRGGELWNSSAALRNRFECCDRTWHSTVIHYITWKFFNVA